MMASCSAQQHCLGAELRENQWPGWDMAGGVESAGCFPGEHPLPFWSVSPLPWALALLNVAFLCCLGLYNSNILPEERLKF